MALALQLLERVFGRGGIVAWHGIGEDPLWPAMHATPERLAEQVEFLVQHYTIIPLGELLRRWQSGQNSDGCVALTFDDAYLGLLEAAHPLLSRRALPATIFVSTAHAEWAAGYWWDLAELSRRQSGVAWSRLVGRIELTGLSPDDPQAMDLVRDRVLHRYAGRLPAAAGDSDCFSHGPWRSMSFQQLEQLAQEARYDFACHTVTHPALPFLSPPQQEQEISEGFRTVRERLGRALPVLAYPYGLYDRDTIAAARRAGMTAAVTMEGRAPGRRPEPYTIPRVGLGAVHDRRSIALRLNRAFRAVLIARNRGVHPRLPTDPVLQPAGNRPR